MKLFRRKERGAAVVEFALVFGILLMFFFGIVEFGFLWTSSNSIANAAREGARVASKIKGTDTAAVNDREDAAIAAAKAYLEASIIFSNLIDNEPDFLSTVYTRDPEKTVSVDIDGDGTDETLPMAEVTVTLQTHMIWEPILWPLLSALIPGVNFDSNKLRELSQSASFIIEG